jgi:signal transduction histidine kinase
MRRRLFAGYLTVLALIVLGLTVPLAVVVAAHAGQGLAADRAAQTARLAADAADALTLTADATVDTTRPSLADLVARYAAQSGARVVVVSAGGDPVAWSDPTLTRPDPNLAAALAHARAGEPRHDPGPIWPWRTDPLVVAEPVVDDGVVVGAVATLSPVDGPRTATVVRWLLLAVADAAALALALLTLRPVTRWILRPVALLDRAARQWRHGSSAEPFDIGPGPQELRELSDSFNDFAQRISILLARQRAFASYASHQLRTPLAILRLSVESLRPDERDEDRLAEYEAVVAELDRMARICESMLAYASAETVAAEIADVDVSALADQRVERWRPAAQQAGVTIERRGMPGVVARVAHEAVGQCLDVFIDNAVKYAGSGARIVVATYPLPGRRVQVDVIDNGPGVPGNDPGRAVQAFWRDQATAHLNGAGLGVTIADALVTASGGQLSLLPVRPHGLRVRLLLPSGDPGLTGPGPADVTEVTYRETLSG